MKKQIIFDCDGVLVDTEIIAAEIMVELLSSLGYTIDVNIYINEHTGKTFTGVIDSVGVKLEKDLEVVAKETEEKIYANLRSITGMPELVLDIQQPVAIASNSANWQVEKAIDHLGLVEKVGSNYFTSEMVNRPKPFPDVYLKASEQTGVAPEHCLVIEDSISGAKSALGAGMYVIGFCGGSHITADHHYRLRDLGIERIANNSSELRVLLQEYLP